MNKIQVPKGAFDILPVEPNKNFPWRESTLWQYLENVIRETAEIYGFKEIRTPIFESTELFKRGVGEDSDIVTKEMYTFEDKGGRSLTLRPEGTAAVMRSIVEKNLIQHSPFQKYFYIGPCFRYERPQAGRYRQHHQFGIEAVGIKSPEQDAEVIDFVFTLYKKLKISNLTIYLNTLGDSSHRLAFREALIHYFTPHKDSLSEDSQRRLETNPLRILDSKNSKDQEIAKEAPTLLSFIKGDALAHFEKVKTLLKQLNIPYQINQNLVRGLDYYNRTVFEITSGNLGAQNSIGGGGRYDGLIELLGGSNTPSVGFATGLERILQTLINQNVDLPKIKPPTIYLIPLGESAQNYCFTLLNTLRQHQIYTELSMDHKKIKQAMKHADALGAQFVAVIGDEELNNQELHLKSMHDRKEHTLSFSKLVNFLSNR